MYFTYIIQTHIEWKGFTSYLDRSFFNNLGILREVYNTTTPLNCFQLRDLNPLGVKGGRKADIDSWTGVYHARSLLLGCF